MDLMSLRSRSHIYIYIYYKITYLNNYKIYNILLLFCFRYFFSGYQNLYITKIKKINNNIYKY